MPQFDEIGLNEIREIEERSYAIIEKLRDRVFEPDRTKRLGLRFNIGKTAEMIGRTTTALRDAEKAGKLPLPLMDERNRRLGYTLDEINDMRKHFGTLPWRSATDEPLILAIQK